MNRYPSAKITGLRIPPSRTGNFLIPNSESALNLKSRLIERGISSHPLPSVKRPKVSQSQQKITVMNTLSSQPESKLMIRPPTRTSVTGFTSMAALRPSSAIKNLKIPASLITRTANQPARPNTARTNNTINQKINTSRTELETKDTARLANLIDKLRNSSSNFNYQSVNRPTSAKKKDLGDTPLPKSLEGTRKDYEETKLDEFIRCVKEKNVEENEFVYLLRVQMRYNFDYVVVGPEEARQGYAEEFYTLSAKGLSVFVGGSPIEFIRFNDFLIERKHFLNLQNIAFFQQFRVWKTVKMWLRNVNHYRRERRRKKLEEKLYLVDDSYSKVLLTHRTMCLEIEKMKFIEIPGYLDQLTLTEFVAKQRERIHEVRTYIIETKRVLRDNILQGVVSIMNQLREDIVMDIAAEKNYGKLNLQMFPLARKIVSLYEKMGFPENMSYGQRSVLRKECSRYIRFTYLVDFIALESLKNLYLLSVRELLLKIYEQVDDSNEISDIQSDKSIVIQAESKKRNRMPLFKVSLKMKVLPVQSEMKIPINSEFVPRKSPADEFHPNIHLSFDDRTEASPAHYIDNLHDYWLEILPTRETFVSELENLIKEGLNCLKLIQRWSKHPEMSDFVAALEDWDDKVTNKWVIPDSLELDVVSWLEDNPLYTNIHHKLTRLIVKAFKRSEIHFSSFEYPIQSYWKNSEIQYDLLEREHLLQKVDSFDWTFNLFKTQKSKIEKAPKLIDSGLLRIDCTETRNNCILNSKDSLKKSQDILLKILKERIESCRVWASRSVRILGSKVFTVEEYVSQKLSLQEVNDKISDIKRNLDLVGHLFSLGVRMEIGLVTEDSDQLQNVLSLMSILNGYIINIESTEAKNMTLFKKKLKAMIPDFLQDVGAMNLRVLEEKYLRVETEAEPAIEDLKSLKLKSAAFKDTAHKLARFQEVLAEPVADFQVVQDFEEQVDVRLKLWTGVKDYENHFKKLKYSSLKNIDPVQAMSQAEEYNKIVRKCENHLPSSTVLNKLKSMVQDILELMPVVTALRAPFLDSHWKSLKEILGENFEINETITLFSLSKYKIKENSEAITSIATQASQENELKSQLNSIVSLWEELEIPLQQYKDKDMWILGDIDVFVTNLEESLAKISLIAGNRYVEPLRNEVVAWRNYLNIMQDVLDEWTSLQKTWMYFYAIFSSQDIKRRLASETQIFESVDKFYRTLMKKVNLSNNALKVMVLEGKLLESLKKHNNSLDLVQRNLSQYLEDKRMIFPRFYFISDEELLKILAQSSNPLSLQGYITKCFENIYRLEFGEDLKSSDILGMISSEGENVSFGGKMLKARGNVEEWLGNVESVMIDTLTKAMKYCKEDSEKTPFRKLVLGTYPCQIISTVCQINWCIETDVALGSVHDSPNVLNDWMALSRNNLNELVMLVRTVLPDLKRKLIVAMITTSVHNRDILNTLQELDVQSNSEFNWQQQLRYYWDTDLCIIKQINFSYPYGYEYLGCTSRLVITPLTEKCWITITSALNIKLGACPSGPAGTGKTESTKDLAKALGQFCIVYNCSDQISYKMIGKLLAGLVQQGAWSCLDEFNRIDIEVLSVVAQQLQIIRHAQLSNLKDFVFETRKISIKPGFGVFVTMNPGYAGRTELPDNLKVMFRPVAMMIPDYAMISEMMLLAEGFIEGTRLSKKIVQLYKLASEQLSVQFHYDFGLRALKSVLMMAGDLRRKLVDENEEIILIQAMNQTNLPKLVDKDLNLFKALVTDLFPGLALPLPDHSEFKNSIKKVLESQGHTSTESLQNKILELNDTVQIRFGSMLVGPPMSGKTVVCSTLASIKEITVHCLNPKSITIGELYGDINPLTQDWKDGLASSVLREITNLADPERHWVVFDGPVDSLWIESMNTVLDDNMMLCLPNGERIKLKPSMRILFEVIELSKASPATVSRCGMVYIPSENLTWTIISAKWLSKIHNKEIKEYLSNMFTTVVPVILKTYNVSTDALYTSEIHKVQSLCNILDIVLAKHAKLKHMPSIFAFAAIWALGSLVDSSQYEKVIYK